MKTPYFHATARRSILASVNAAVLIFTLVLMQFPAVAVAQEEPADVTSPEVTEQVVTPDPKVPDGLTDDTTPPVDPEASVDAPKDTEEEAVEPPTETVETPSVETEEVVETPEEEAPAEARMMLLAVPDEQEGDQCVIVSDEETLEDGDASVVLSYINTRWTAVMDVIAKWIWGEEPSLADTSANAETQTFTRTFSIEQEPTGGTLLIAADNGYVVTLNSVELHADPSEQNYTSAGQDVINIDAEDLNVGVNTLVITVTNKPQSASTWKDNPAGLRYKLTVDGSDCGDPKPETATVVMCKTDTEDQPLSGWTLTLKGKNIQSGLLIPVADSDGVDSNSLVSGMSYIATAMGTWFNDRGDVNGNYVDAEYSTNSSPSWSVAMDGYDGFGTNVLELEIDGNDGDWGPVNGTHTYAQPFIASGSSANFAISDTYYGDNKNSTLAVSIDEGYAGVTEENGCITFKNVPYGTYTAGEIMQDGWSTVEGTGSVTVDEPNETFVIVNEIDAEPTLLKVHIYKYLTGEGTTQVGNDSGAPSFSMLASWNAVIDGSPSSGTNASYVLGNFHGGASFKYAADTSFMQAPADYTTSEVTDGSVVVGHNQQCVQGKYRLVGYKWGMTLAEAQATTTITTTAPVFTDLESDRHVIVINEDCDDVINNVPTSTSETVVVTPSDMKGWAFVQETANGSGSLVAGPLAAPLGSGSANLIVDALGGELFGAAKHIGVRLADITQMTYRSYRASGDPALAASIQLNIDSDVSDANNTWQGRLVYEPYYTQTVSTGAWQTWNALNDAAGLATGNWWFSNGALSGPSGCTQANPCTWSEVKTAFPNAGIHPTLGAVGFKAGSNWATGFNGNVDQFVIGVKTGLNTHVTTYDFEPAEVTITNTDTNRSGGGGSSNKKSTAQQGEVLGASTAACDILLSTFMRMGIENDAAEVTELQGFLNEHMGAMLPLSGVFGPMTDAAVHAFQKKYWEDVLKPWFPYPEAGIADMDDSTGYVYKTTQWKINDIVCPDIAPFPKLP